MNTNQWAFRRKLSIVLVLLAFFTLVAVWIYFAFVYEAPSCFDNEKNNGEAGIDCGGDCVRICAFQVIPPKVKWVKAFKIIDGQYNVVAYIENQNLHASTPEMDYTITLSDASGVIAERSGTTILPPDNTYPIFEGRVKTFNRVPTDVSIQLSEPELWLPVEEVREQFTLVDRGEIVGADSAPRLQSAIRNNGLVMAEDVEVVTTIFNSLGEALTASRTFVDLPSEEVTDVIFTWPEPIAKTVRSCEVPTDVILAIDLSGSMNNEGGVPPEPLASVKRAAESFVSRLGVTDRVGVITFATGGEMVVPLSPQPATIAANIAQLDIDPEEETGSTNSGAAMDLATQEFATERHNPDARRVLVLLTDGLTNEPEPEPEAYALERAAVLKESGVELFTIGLGADVNEEFLRNMATSPDTYFRTISTSQIDSIYRSITEAICEEGAARVDVLPKSDINFISWP